MGIHWRTRILAPNVSALAKAAWDQRGWNPGFEQGSCRAGAEAARRAVEAATSPHSPATRSPTPTTPPLYQTVRYDTGAYRLDVPNGAYTVDAQVLRAGTTTRSRQARLRREDPGQAGHRAASTSSPRSGKNKALDFTFKDIEVDRRPAARSSSPSEVEYPCIAAIAVDG